MSALHGVRYQRRPDSERLYARSERSLRTLLSSSSRGGRTYMSRLEPFVWKDADLTSLFFTLHPFSTARDRSRRIKWRWSDGASPQTSPFYTSLCLQRTIMASGALLSSGFIDDMRPNYVRFLRHFSDSDTKKCVTKDLITLPTVICSSISLLWQIYIDNGLLRCIWHRNHAVWVPLDGYTFFD